MGSNQELAKILTEMAALLDMKEVPFKPRAYERAAFSIGSLSEDIDEIYKKKGLKGLEEVPGVGKGIAERIEEYIKSGHIRDYQELKKEFPVDVSGLSAIEGVGPHVIRKLYRELGIKTVGDLTKAARTHKIRELAGMGEKSEQKILKSIGFLEKSHGRCILAFIMPAVTKILDALRRLPEVRRAEVAGSARRMQETVGDLDFLVLSSKPEKVMDFFAGMPEVADVIARGPTKTSVRLKTGIKADVRVIAPESFGAALQYFTGDKYHNIAVREIAVKNGYKLNEYGLFKGKKLIAAETEEKIYQALDMACPPPEIRTNRGEIEMALKNQLPDLIGYNDLKGDLQVQTDWTDGENTIKEMAEAAKKEGLEYIVITDHTKTLAMTGGCDEKKLMSQIEEIDRIQKQVSGIKILKGAEVNILKDGTLDINDQTLAKLEVVGASVHSHFSMSEKDMTARIIRAMENPNVDIIFHPTGRLIQKREPYKVDMDKIIAAAKRTKTVLEVNAWPERLDLEDDHVRKALAAEVKLAIDSDAHAVSHFKYLEFGIGLSRRGWAEKKDVVNAASYEEMLKMLK